MKARLVVGGPRDGVTVGISGWRDPIVVPHMLEREYLYAFTEICTRPLYETAFYQARMLAGLPVHTPDLQILFDYMGTS